MVSVFNPKHIGGSIKNAGSGLRFIVATERVFRIHLTAAVIVVASIIIFPFTFIESAALVGMVTFVLSLEVLNTALENTLDILKPRLDPAIGLIKNMLAGAVLIASIGALIVGLIIVIPYLL